MPSERTGVPRYNNKPFQICQDELDSAIARGITQAKLEAFFVAYYTEQSKIINPSEMQDVTALTLEKNILKPRQDLYFFILHNWIRAIFIPSLDAKLVKNLLVFGVGRIFSAYSNIGVQYCTDADLNFVVRDTLTKAEIAALTAEVKRLKARIWELFSIIVEVDSSFTVLKVRDIKARLTHSDRDARLAATLFYKGNADSLFVIFDNSELRAEVFAEVRELPDALLFDNFLGKNPVKTTFSRLRDDEVQLSVISDTTQQKECVDTLIGTRAFLHQCRRLTAIHPELYPPEWCFSMKYTVNRVYDYVSAMLHSGHSLAELGFTGASDPDYNFLCQAHRLMLFLQELIHVKLDTYNYLSDYSYISSDRFSSFMRIPKGSFRADFDDLVMGTTFLFASQKKHYLALKQAIQTKQELQLSLTADQVKELTKLFGFSFRHLDKGSGRIPVAVPYTWSGLGFYVFSAVESRLSTIVDSKLAPAVRAG